MNKFFKILLFLALPISIIAQNTPPEVTITGVQVDTFFNRVTFFYDLTDAEDTLLLVDLRISVDSGKTFVVIPDNVSGDIGEVSPGNAQQIDWIYEPASLPVLNSQTPFKAKIIARDFHPPSIQTMVNLVDSNRIKEDLQWMEGVRHRSAGAVLLQATKDSLTTRFQRLGLQSDIQSFPYGNYTGQNIIGKKFGKLRAQRVWINDAHFDSVIGSPGADDNASGTVGMLEVARILSQFNFEESISFIGFDLEEAGLLGSISYVLNPPEHSQEISGVINLEMIGYYSDLPNSQTLPPGFDILFPAASDSVKAQENKGNFITNVGNENSSALVSLFKSSAQTWVPDLRVIDVITPGNGQITPDLRRSDHAPFWDAGFQALMITDGSEFRNSNYHTPGDLVSTLDIHFLTNVVKTTVATLAAAAIPIHSGESQSDYFTIPDVISTARMNKVNTFTFGPVIPNPTSDFWSVPYQLKEIMDVTLTLIGPDGSVLSNQQRKKQLPGFYTWHSTDLPGAKEASLEGMYLIQMTGRDLWGQSHSETLKIIRIHHQH